MYTRKALVFILLLLSLALSACGGGKPAPTPTLSIAEIQAQAIATFAIGLTQTALAAPTATPTATLSPTPFSTLPVTSPFPTATSAVVINPTASCYGLTWVKDVTIPDNTVVNPGQSFTKTWLVQNSGSCAWEAGFKLVFISGEAMNGQTLTLSQSVAPGAQIELSVPMIAPTNKTGTVRGDWRMSTATGTFFGDQIYIQIVIGNSTLTPTGQVPSATPTATSTSTPTATPTP
jgi:hypothetical protein